MGLETLGQSGGAGARQLHVMLSDIYVSDWSTLSGPDLHIGEIFSGSLHQHVLGSNLDIKWTSLLYQTRNHYHYVPVMIQMSILP